MKQRLLIISIVFILVVLLPISSAFAQTTDNAAWSLLSGMTSSATTNVAATSAVLGDSLSAKTLAYNSTFGTVAGWQRLPAGTTPNNYITNGYFAACYAEYALTPAAGKYFVTDSVTMNLLGGGTGNDKVAVYYSMGYFKSAPGTALGTATYHGTSTTTYAATTSTPIALLNSGSATAAAQGYTQFTPNITVNYGDTLRIRVYPWCTAAGKYLADKNIGIYGKTYDIVVPTVTTTSISSVTANSGVSGGNVTASGGATVTARGVCWNTTGSPTIVDDHTTDGTGTGSFTSSLATLSPGTTYYYCAYATNSGGTGYGTVSSFTTSSAYYNAANSDISNPNNWGTSADGTGTHPADFTGNATTYYLYNTGSTMGSAWSVTGTNSVVVLGDGSIANSLTIPAGSAYTGTINVSSQATLIIQNATNPTFGTISTSSTVVFDGSASMTIPAISFGNLSSTNDGSASRTLASSGTMSIVGSFTPGSATYTTTGSTISFNGTSAQSIPAFPYNNLTISNAAGCTASGNMTVGGTLVVNQNFSIPAADTITLLSGGTLTIASGKTFTVAGGFDNQSSNALTLTGTMFVSGTYTLDAATGYIPAATYQNGSWLIVHTNVETTNRLPTTIGGNLKLDLGGGSIGGFLLSSTTTVGGDLYFNAGANNGTGGSPRTLQVNGNMYMQGGEYDVAGTGATAAMSLIVNGNLTVSGGTLYASNSSAGGLGTITVKGNIIHTAGALGISSTTTSGVIALAGTIAQTIQTIGLANNPTVTINNAAGVSLASDLAINNTLNLTLGVLSLGSYNLQLGASAVIGGTPTATAMIYANGTGECRRLFSTSGSFTFPIGDVVSSTAEYAPATVSVSAADYSSGAAYVTVNTTRSKQPNNTSATNYLNRYWTVNSSGLIDASYTGTFTYPAADVAGDELLIFGAHYTGGIWSNVGVVSTTNHNFSTPTLVVLGDFTCADGTVVPTVPILSVSSAGLSFGRVGRGTTSSEKNYTVTGYYLSPSDDSVTVTAPANYEISLTSGSGFTSSLKIPYTSSFLSATTIFVHFVAPYVTGTTTYNGTITNAGGSASIQNVSVSAKSIISAADLGVDMVIAADGTGDYTTVQAAFNAIPATHTSSPYKVYIRTGTYFEQVALPSTVRDIQLIGEDRDSTILAYNKYAVSGTFNASTTLNGNNVTATNLTFKNTAGDSAQALALMTAGDSIVFTNCRIMAKQDTYLGNGLGRVYFKDCFIEGTVDFIYGRSVMVFDSCTIHVIRDGGYITAASTDAASKFGINFLNCTITNDAMDYRGVTFVGYYLGRPWQASPRVVYIRCYEPATILPVGWTTMSATPALYGEYQCKGPGYSPSSRTTLWGIAVRTLSDTEALNYTISNIFASSTYSTFTNNWMPAGAVDVVLPVELTSFTATANGLNANLVWKTATEKNNFGFNIERRVVGTSAWTKVGFVAGNGTSNTAHAYSYADTKVAAGTYVYRIAQIDNDGSLSYSSEAQVAIGVAEKILTLANYPNPFNPTTTIQFSVPNDGKAVVKIYNVLGQEVVTAFSGDVKAGQYNQATFDGTKLSSGVYFYTIESNNLRMVKKMLMMK